MKTPRTDIASILASRTLQKGLGKAEIMSLAAYLLEEGRTGELDSLLRDVQADWAKDGVVEVIASSAHELSPQVIKDIEAEARSIYKDAKRIIITTKIDPEIVGGVRLAFVDYRLDLSVAGELKKFKTLATNGKD
jgi:F-type H+-transporting ATPase subunit delta